MDEQFLEAWKSEALSYGDEAMARIINAAMWHKNEVAIEGLREHHAELEGEAEHDPGGPPPLFSFDMADIAQYDAECLYCGTEPEKRTCEGCGLSLDILDCGHDHVQPKDIDYCDDGRTMACQDCYEKRQKAREYDERFDGLVNLDRLTWEEYAIMDELVARLDTTPDFAACHTPKQRKERLHWDEFLLNMQIHRKDGEEIGGWRSILAQYGEDQ